MSNERILIDDLVVLGNAVPDVISDSRITVCTAGFSKKHGLIRIYPVPPRSHMKRWNVVTVPLERNSKDTRSESWKIQGSKSEWTQIASKIELNDVVDSKEKKLDLLENLSERFGASCIEELNSKKVSLGIIKPQIISHGFEKRTDYEGTAQATLGVEKPFLTIKNYPLKPVITYRCPDCRAQGPHHQQVVEWGIYEWVRQNPNRADEAWDNLHIGEENYYTSFLVGNMALHRNSFMIISIFRLKLPC